MGVDEPFGCLFVGLVFLALVVVGVGCGCVVVEGVCEFVCEGAAVVGCSEVGSEADGACGVVVVAFGALGVGGEGDAVCVCEVVEVVFVQWLGS